MSNPSSRLSGPWSRVRKFLPKASDYNLKYGRVDLLAGITVAFVALPLALGFGVTSGAGATAGLITAVVAGVVASIFGGSHFQITGPTGAMTAILLPIVALHGPVVLPILGVGAGLILLLLGIAGVGQYVRFIPWPVVTGFTNGIAIIIFLQQLPNVLGTAPPRGESIVFLSFQTVRMWLGEPGFITIFVALLTVAIMVGWGRVKQLAVVPGSMAALVIVTLLAQLPFLSEVPRIGVIPRSLPLPAFPTVITDGWVDLARAAIAIAVLAALESLLKSEAKRA